MQFRTKARAVDLLGKGQIADLPTAITELWKNGYDAYADKLSAELYVAGYQGIESPIFIISDDGTGMSQMHITHLDVLCSYGIIPFCLFIYILRSIALTINSSSKTLEQYVSLCAFLSVLLFGVFEAALFQRL